MYLELLLSFPKYDHLFLSFLLHTQLYASVCNTLNISYMYVLESKEGMYVYPVLFLLTPTYDSLNSLIQSLEHIARSYSVKFCGPKIEKFSPTDVYFCQ